MLRLRLATAAVAIPTLLALILWAPIWGFALFVGVTAALSVLEYMFLAFAEQPRERWVFGALGALAVAGWACRGVGVFDHPLLDQELPQAGLALFLTGGLIWVLLARADFEAGLVDLGRALVGLLFGGFLLVHFIWLQMLPDGPRWVIFVIMTAMAGDSAGYFVGHAIGRHKLMPRVSPGKTVEGSLGQLGDLCESVVKRTYGAKDSGKLFPGHGGLLDRIDSLVFPVAGVYYYVTFCR